MNERDLRWRDWMANVRRSLLAMPASIPVTGELAEFYYRHYIMHEPYSFKAPHGPSFEWSRGSLLSRLGNMMVEVQSRRSQTPDYEVSSYSLKERMPFDEFIDRAMTGPVNDVYLTANNSASNPELTRALAPDLMPLPHMLVPNPSAGYLWIGRDTITPMHHDLTQNLLIQHVGVKCVRLICPSQHHLMENHIWVHSRLGWLDNEEAARRGIFYQDFLMLPGDALFIPVGWWHCVTAHGFSVTSTWVNFPWPNSYVDGFPA